MKSASMPPITNHAMAVYMYNWPIFLWSVVESQLQMPLSYLCALPVTDGAATVVAIPGLRYFRDERYAARSAICRSSKAPIDSGRPFPMGGMITPGFMSRASLIHMVRCFMSFGYRPAPIVVRLPTCVKLGPMMPGDTPWIVWHPMHAAVLKSCAPRPASAL